MNKLIVVGAGSQTEIIKLIEIMKTLEREKGMRVEIGRSGLISTPEPVRLEVRRFSHDRYYDHYYEDMRQEELEKREIQESKDFIAAKSGKPARHDGIFKSVISARNHRPGSRCLSTHRKRGN